MKLKEKKLKIKKINKSQASSSPHLEIEKSLGYPELKIAGVDEVGRGCLAGPVVAAALILPQQINFEKDSWLLEIKDSKILNASTREKLYPMIEKWALSYCISSASVEEIDNINIFHASHLAMQRAVQGLHILPHALLVDGKFLPKSGFNKISATAVIKGDLKCLSIAAASILAKVWRDRWMIDLAKKFPHYDFIGNKGYPTPAHKQGILKFGITPFHRKSFKLISSSP